MMRPLDSRAAALALASMVEWMAFRRFASRERVGPVAPEEIDDVVATVGDLWFQALYGRADPATLI